MAMDSMKTEAMQPHGVWAHAFEEDEGDLRVFRPVASHPFPPSRRGRERLVFGDNGEVIHQWPGPDDRLINAPTAQLAQQRFAWLGVDGSATTQQAQIVQLTAQRLVVCLRALP
jgi:hypothetical protein